jgi:transcriptional regulator with GAF, ATPase, and Fis domain
VTTFFLVHQYHETDSLITIAMDMTAALTAEERSQRLLKALHREIPYDAAALFRVQQDELVITAATGLSPDAMGRRFRLKGHPRLDIICTAREPVRFPGDSQLPDPFSDGRELSHKGITVIPIRAKRLLDRSRAGPPE